MKGGWVYVEPGKLHERYGKDREKPKGHDYGDQVIIPLHEGQ